MSKKKRPDNSLVVAEHESQMIAMLNEDQAIMEESKQSDEKLLAAIAYYVHWPQISGVIHGLRSDRCNWLILLLGRNHETATLALINEGARVGVDASDLWSAGRYARERMRAGPPPVGINASSQAWPETLGDCRYRLPELLQEAISSAEKALIQLVARLDQKPPSKAKGSKSKRKTNAEWRDIIEEFNGADINQKDFAKARGIKPNTFTAALIRLT